jgi:hypothetical protein
MHGRAMLALLWRLPGFNRVLGNFIENEAIVVPANSTLITIFAGANDVNVITGALGAGEGGSDQIGYINNQVQAFGADDTTLLNMLRTRASAARVVVLNLPNMGAMPFVAGASAEQRQAAEVVAAATPTCKAPQATCPSMSPIP